MGTAYLPTPLHKIAYRFFATIVPTSNLMLFLDVSPTEAHNRVCKRGGELEMFENLEELEKTRRKALNLATENRWKILNADKPMREVQEEIRRHIEMTS